VRVIAANPKAAYSSPALRMPSRNFPIGLGVVVYIYLDKLGEFIGRLRRGGHIDRQIDATLEPAE
jgi:hypothetical protein